MESDSLWLLQFEIVDLQGTGATHILEVDRQMTTVIDELSRDDIDLNQADIQIRVDDWRKRIAALHDSIESWLPAGFQVDRTRTVNMNEELMRRHNVPATKLPVLNISHDGERVAKLVPRGLWIIGSNGRVDMLARGTHFLVVDRASNLDEPDWRIAPADRRRDLEPLGPDIVRRVIAA